MEKRNFLGLITCFFAVSLALQTADQTTEPFCNKDDGTCPDRTTKGEDLTTINPYDVIKFLASKISTRPAHNESEKKLLVILEYVISAIVLSGIAYLIMTCCPRCRTRPEESESSRPNETGNQGEDISIGLSEREPSRSLQQETNDESSELPSIPSYTSSDDVDENSLSSYEWPETAII